MGVRDEDLTVGVLGGMGPEATLDFFAKVLAATPAARDQEHLRLLIDNDPRVPDRSAGIAGTGPSPGPALAAMARRLERAGADFLVMPCNSAHAFRAAIDEAVAVPLLSIVEEAAAEALRRRPGLATAGVLATAGTMDAGLYREALEARGVAVLEPRGADRERLMELIYAVKAGDKGPEVRAGMAALGEALVREGAEVVLAGCTEVPLALADGDLSVPLVDTTEALALATVACARRERPLPARTERA